MQPICSMETLNYVSSRTHTRAVRSPQILELSGIGDKRILEPLGIPVIIDLPGVGENMQEHIVGNIVYGE